LIGRALNKFPHSFIYLIYLFLSKKNTNMILRLQQWQVKATYSTTTSKKKKKKHLLLNEIAETKSIFFFRFFSWIIKVLAQWYLGLSYFLLIWCVKPCLDSRVSNDIFITEFTKRKKRIRNHINPKKSSYYRFISNLGGRQIFPCSMWCMFLSLSLYVTLLNHWCFFWTSHGYELLLFTMKYDRTLW